MAEEKKDAVIAMSDPKARAEREARRGITRNEKGEIVFSKAQKKERIARLEAKLEDCAIRTKNIKAEIKRLSA